MLSTFSELDMGQQEKDLETAVSKRGAPCHYMGSSEAAVGYLH